MLKPFLLFQLNSIENFSRFSFQSKKKIEAQNTLQGVSDDHHIVENSEFTMTISGTTMCKY
jgi:hypothetical protein